MGSDQLFKRLLNDIRVDLTDEFDQNFNRKAFFDQPWPANKMNNRRGSMMARTNNLRRSVQSRISGNTILWSSSAIYAELHNNGGKIKVTAKMRKFFWAKYYELAGNRKASAEAGMWKAMALKPVGSVITIPQRQYIGTHARVHDSINRAGDDFYKDLEAYENSLFKKK